MAFEETREQQQMYNYFRSCIYVFLIIEIVMNLPITADNRITQFILDLLGRFKVFNSVAGCKMIELVCICVVCIGTKAKKALKFNVKTMVIYPVLAGLTLVGLCFIFHGVPLGMEMMGFPANRIIYAFCSIAGTMLVHQGLDGIAKYYNHRVGEDRFNFENESFQQSEKKVENPYSVNIPMIYYYKRKMHNGFINITNPFRATIVLGTPGSGKSFGIIDPFIRQHSAKGFAMMVYDYKFPTLAKTLFYQYCKNKRNGKLPNNCGFRIVNFTDVEYSNRINPIQRKYIPDLAAASETAATLLASLNKGGGEKKGGSEAFFTNSAENFLAAIIYFFVNLHPTGFKDGKKLKRFIAYEGKKLEIVIRNWFDYNAIDDKGEVVLDFIDDQSRNHSIDEDGMFVDLNGYSYTKRTGETVRIDRCWYEDEHGNEVEPDTITGEYSDMPHVLSFLGHGYKEIFDILMQDDKIASLMAPFKSAFENKANDQLEGMVGTLRVNAARLVSPEAYWVFTGDDFDLKISDPENPSYLIIANDPEKEQVIGSLNALVLNRLITRVNSKGNIPVSIIVDELPTLYFHKIDRLIGTARSNKVAVTLGFQELPQLEADYGKVGMQKIITTCGNIFMGAARNKETLEWAQNDVFGKAKQTSTSITINDSKVSTQISERLDFLVPAAKIADMATGWLAGQAARDFTATDKSMMSHFDIEQSEEFKTTKYFCKTNFDMKQIHDEEAHYVELPKIYEFKDEREKEIMLNRNFKRVNQEVEEIIRVLAGKG
ncbi:type IV secretory system conjugative DNA transfer family protein [Paramuribaculum intestinale]|uniref:Type IV secretory system conjugative DNA transfer family protein n=1 Tax=Paramuribaculum intestinale TaxID=2094151 RepID=A0A2V1IW08_9BACT|nr:MULTISPECIES: type IV secretory system conjugative DNA transfer family protein [Muribaculaceae]MBJ2185965.1 type IV secretory system conjugative DNA transfer family protein [Muribaculaceae bacterium]ROS90698.1 type IV secretory system conjugative DNA transfer family protein [Muribaculaceae bacterium Isolate-043 (Harlan)]MCX4277724.1 type IV secretory system conjugative DNA transfer family protein [Muribaculum sp.]PWB06950.1 type IV secretory system conjugative DNA transfer family protein [Pa